MPVAAGVGAGWVTDRVARVVRGLEEEGVGVEVDGEAFTDGPDGRGLDGAEGEGRGIWLGGGGCAGAAGVRGGGGCGGIVGCVGAGGADSV